MKLIVIIMCCLQVNYMFLPPTRTKHILILFDKKGKMSDVHNQIIYGRNVREYLEATAPNYRIYPVDVNIDEAPEVYQRLYSLAKKDSLPSLICRDFNGPLPKTIEKFKETIE